MGEKSLPVTFLTESMYVCLYIYIYMHLSVYQELKKQHHKYQIAQSIYEQIEQYKWPIYVWKNCSTSLFIRKMGIKTALGFYLIPVKVDIIKNSHTHTRTTTTNACKEKEHFCAAHMDAI